MCTYVYIPLIEEDVLILTCHIVLAIQIHSMTIGILIIIHLHISIVHSLEMDLIAQAWDSAQAQDLM